MIYVWSHTDCSILEVVTQVEVGRVWPALPYFADINIELLADLLFKSGLFIFKIDLNKQGGSNYDYVK